MKLRVTVGGQAYDVDVEILEKHGGPVSAAPVAPRAPAPRPAPAAAPRPSAPAPAPAPAAGGKSLNSPIPGTVVEILVKPGQAVKHNEPMLILDAMKMNTQIAANADATVKEILVNVGDAVKMGQALVLFE